MTNQASAQEWATAVSKNQAQDRAVVFRYISSFAPGFTPTSQPIRVILVWKYESDSGMPSLTERESMDSLEDTLSPTIESNGFATLALVSTGENSREWIYYAKSEEQFMTMLNTALKGEPSFPIEIHSAPDPKWSTYKEFVSGVVGGHG